MANQYDSFPGGDDLPLAPPSSEERTIAMLSHILTVVPGVGILAPLIIYLLKKDDSQFVAYHSRESLNFQITLYIVGFVLIITVIGILFLWVLWLVEVIFVVIATIKANENRLYRYPFGVRLVK